MKRAIVYFVFGIFICFESYSQTTIAKLKYEEAEENFSQGNYQTALVKLSEAEKIFGKVNPLIMYLRIMAQHQQIKSKPLKAIPSIVEIKKNCQFFLKEYETVDNIQEKYRDVYKVSEAYASYPNTIEGHPKGGSFITITVKGMEYQTLLLANYYGNKTLLTDTAYADSKGCVVFSNKVKWPVGLYLIVTPDKKYFEFILKENSFTLETTYPAFERNMKVTGSFENKVYFEFYNAESSLGIRRDSLNSLLSQFPQDSLRIKEKINLLGEENKKNKMEVIKNYPLSQFAYMLKVVGATHVENKYRLFDEVKFSDSSLIRTPLYHNKIKEFIVSRTEQNKDSIIASADWLISKSRANKEMFKYTVWYIMNYYETASIPVGSDIFIHMADKYYRTGQAYWATQETINKIAQKSDELKAKQVAIQKQERKKR